MVTSSPYIIHLRFNQALIIVRSIPEREVGLQPIPTDRLKFYSLYKQAIFGKCNTTKPSSRNVVEYAKWKAWYRVKHYSCIEAKTLYVNLLVELLVEFINRYPNNAHHEFAKQALISLESNVFTGSEVAYDPKESFLSSFIPDIPLTTIQHHHTIASTYYTKSPSLQASTIPSSVTTHYNGDHSLAPERTPQYHPTWKSNRIMSTVKDLKIPEQYLIKTSSSSVSSSIEKHHHQQNDTGRKLSSLTERKALEKLQVDIATLTSQMNHLGQDILLSYGGSRVRRHNSTMFMLVWQLVKTLVRHLLVNTLITGFVFWILWYQQSPIIHAMVDFLTPRIKTLVHSSIIKNMVFWKLKM